MGLIKFFSLSLSVFLVCAFVLFFAVLYVVQEKLIFQPDVLPESFPYQFHLPFEERRISVDFEGAKISIDSLMFRTPGAKSLILYFHGNAGNLSSWGFVAEELAKRTASNVWVLDYPGYGKSSGSIRSEKQLRTIAENFYDAAAKEAATDHLKFFIYGRSIGTGLAAFLASEHASDGLVLESPYYNLVRLARRTVFFVPLFLLKYQLPTNEWLANVKAPVLMIHGDQDTVIPVSHSRELKAKILPSANLVIVEGRGHNDLSETKEYWKAVEEFIR